MQDQKQKEREREAARRLLAELTHAVHTGARRLQVAPGRYRFDAQTVFSLHGAKDLTVEGNGAEIINEGKHSSLRLQNCARVTIRDFVIDCDPVPFSQGTVVMIDREDRSITVEIDEGYPVPGPERAPCRTILFDPTGRFLRPVWCNDTATDFLPCGDRLVRFHQQRRGAVYNDDRTGVCVGDRIGFPFRSGDAGIRLDGCCACRIENCRVYASPGFGVGDFSGEGGTVYSGLQIVPRPGTGRLLSVSSDGFHAYQLRRGPYLLGCEISHSQDDLVNIHRFFAACVRQESERVLLLSIPFRYPDCVPVGGRLQIYDMRGLTVRSEAKILRAEYPDGNSGEELRKDFADRGLWLRTMDIAGDVRVELDRPVEAERLDICTFTEEGSGGAMLRDCYLHHGFVRGMMLRIPDSTVEDNRFSDILGPAIYINAERFWLEGPFADRVRICGNRISRCGYGPDWYGAVYGAISVVTDPGDDPNGCFRSYHYHDLTLTDNEIAGSGGAAVLLSNVDGAEVRGNRILGVYTDGPQPQAGRVLKTPEPYGAVVSVHSRGIVYADNTVEELPDFCTERKEYGTEPCTAE